MFVGWDECKRFFGRFPLFWLYYFFDKAINLSVEIAAGSVKLRQVPRCAARVEGSRGSALEAVAVELATDVL